jgi:hypothetical protein
LLDGIRVPEHEVDTRIFNRRKIDLALIENLQGSSIRCGAAQRLMTIEL